MAPRIDLRFRPSLIIFVNQPGKEICQQLKQIIQMTQLDELLHQCIALVQVTTSKKVTTDEEDAPDPNAVDEQLPDEESDEEEPDEQLPDEESDEEESDEQLLNQLRQVQVTPIPVGERFPEFDIDMPVEPDYLDDLIAHALRSVQLKKRLIEINQAGYPVPNPRPQIYIVGDAGAKELKAVHAIVQGLLKKRGFTTLVCYVLDAFEASNTGITPPIDDPLGPEDSSYWLQHEVPNFCYFYEDQLNHPTQQTVTEAESHYAAAEALFALIATGITPEPNFEQFMQLPSNLTKYTNVGSIGTTLIIFPREAAMTFCSARLGFTLMQQWLSDINRELLPERGRKQLQERAHKDVEQLEMSIKDVPPRPYANGDENEAKANESRNADLSERQENTWPSLDILKDESHPVSPHILVQQQRLHRDMRDRTKAIFKLFHYSDVAEETRKHRKRRDTWTRLINQRSRRAVEAYEGWNQVANQAWHAAGERACARVKRTVDVLWSSRENGTFGFEMAKTYADAYDDRLVKLQDHLSRLREIHQRDYEDSLDTFDSLSQGVWLAQANTSNILNTPAGATAQVGPTVRGTVDINPPVGPATGNGTGAAGLVRSGTHQHLPAREEQIADQLEQRILWFQDQVPSIPAQITISLPFVLAAILSGLAFYPHHTLLFSLLLIVGVVAVVAAMNWVFWKKYHDRVEDARKDLLRFYRRHYAFRCEQREDALRLMVMVPLRRKLLAMRERLDGIADFISNVQAQLDQQALRLRRELFSSPSGVRDIYIANGERLQNRRRNTIEDFENQVTRLRENRPVQEWHRTLQEMKEQLIESFRTLSQSIIEMNEEDAREHIYAFTCDVTGAYLRGGLVDVGRALDKRQVWQEALDRAQSPLYRAVVGIREPQMLFVCGQGADLNQGQHHWPSGTTPVLIPEHHDWVLIAALFHGGSPPAFDSEILFPRKHIVLAPRSADNPDDEDDGNEHEEDALRGWVTPPPPPGGDGDDSDDQGERETDQASTIPPTPPPLDEEDESVWKSEDTYAVPTTPPLDVVDTLLATPPLHDAANEGDEAYAIPTIPPLPNIPNDDERVGETDDAYAIPATPPVNIPNNKNIDDVSSIELAKSFKRYERDLAYYTCAKTPDPTTAINDRDLELPIPFRLAEIQSDEEAIGTFVNKHLADYHKYASRLDENPTNGLHAFYTSWRCFAVRYGQRALGLPTEQLLPWPERLQDLFVQVQHPDLQQLVKEDMALTPPTSSNLAPVRAQPSLNDQNNDNAAPSIRPNTKKMKAIKLKRMTDNPDITSPVADNS